jgi:hypothetical protein
MLGADTGVLMSSVSGKDVKNAITARQVSAKTYAMTSGCIVDFLESVTAYLAG